MGLIKILFSFLFVFSTKLPPQNFLSFMSNSGTDPSLYGDHLVYDKASLELMAGECQEFGVLVSLRNMAPPYRSLISCLESSIPS